MDHLDHQYNCYYSILNEDDNSQESEMINNEVVIDDTENTEDAATNICVKEKVGDEYLIELYRQRKFLYDKKDRDFKDNEVKNNAWEEISRIMTKDKNLGKYFNMYVMFFHYLQNGYSVLKHFTLSEIYLIKYCVILD